MNLDFFSGRNKKFFSSRNGLGQVRDLANEYREHVPCWVLNQPIRDRENSLPSNIKVEQCFHFVINLHSISQRQIYV